MFAWYYLSFSFNKNLIAHLLGSRHTAGLEDSVHGPCPQGVHSLVGETSTQRDDYRTISLVCGISATLSSMGAPEQVVLFPAFA